jgi:hypothetical protein
MQDPAAEKMRNCWKGAGSAAMYLAVTFTLGCSQSPYELAQVRGTVVVDGQPLPRAKVMFAPVEVTGSANPGKPAFGLLQPDGSFVLTTYNKDDGAIVGEHWVSIINMAAEENGANRAGTPRNSLRFTRMNLPEKRSVVTGKVNQFDFKLTSKDVARLGGQAVE